MAGSPLRSVLSGLIGAGLLLLGSASLGQGPSQGTLSEVSAALSRIEGRVKDLQNSLSRKKEAAPDDMAARRLTDAQVLYTFKNYEAAATILFDVVDRYPKSPVYPEALFYLADSLYQKHDYLSAQRFFQRLIEALPQHARAQESLLRLMEICFHLHAYDQADKWMNRLLQIPRDQAQASVPYVQGKFYFLKQDYERAIATLTAILPQSPYYFQARYFIGAAHVQTRNLADAISDFSGLINQAPRKDEEKRVVELSHMALGRIYYEQGQTTRAQDEYVQISQKSDLFGDSLYESAWVAIKAKEYKRAQRQLELLVLAQPDSLSAPESKLLIGNLQTRQGDYQPATHWFVRTRDEFQPVQKQLDDVLVTHSDPAAYFRGLIDKNLSKFDISLVVGKTAARFLRAEPDVDRFTLLATDVAELRHSIDEAEDTIRRVERALSGAQRYNVDPDLSVARQVSIRLASELVSARGELAGLMLSELTYAATAQERAELQEIGRHRADLARQYARLIGSLGGKNRGEERKTAINDLDKKAAELAVHLTGLRKQREAIQQYYESTHKKQKIRAEQFQKEVADVTAAEEAVTKEYEKLRHDLSELLASADVDATKDESDTAMRAAYGEVLTKEQELMNQLRQRLHGAGRVRADQVGQALARAYADDQALSALATKINQGLDVKFAEMQASLLTEKENVRGYRQALGTASGETQEVGSGVLADALRNTARRFYDIVVRSDVGILDVAWALKQQRTDRVSRLVREQKRELKLLDDEFKEVLKKE